ncbi:hypothetical protein [Azotobacter armeniacus]
MTPFEEGVLYAAALLVRLHDQTTMAADVIREAGLAERDCSVLSDDQKEVARQLP